MLSVQIKNLREKAGFPQNSIASKLDISRPTYIQIEKGERDLTISEAIKLAEIFGVSLEELIGEKQERNVKIEIQKKEKNKTKQDIRINVPQKNIKKLKQVLLYILSKVGAKPNVGETVIYKLLYFIDFDYYEKFEEQLTGSTYIKNHYGPTPVEFKVVVDDMLRFGEMEAVKSKFFQHDQRKYLPLKEPDLSILSAQEVTHIDDVLARLSDKSATELSRYSHEDIPYKVHNFGEATEYESVFYRDDKYSVRNYDDEL